MANDQEIKNTLYNKFYKIGGASNIISEMLGSIYNYSLHNDKDDMKKFVITQYIQKTIDEFDNGPKKGYKNTAERVNGSLTEINRPFSRLERAIIMTYKKYEQLNKEDPSDASNDPMKVTYKCLYDIIENGKNHFTRNTDTQGFSARQYAEDHFRVLSQCTKDPKFAIYNDMCLDVGLGLSKDFYDKRVNEVKNYIDPYDKVITKNYYPKNVNKIREAMQSGLINQVKHVEGNTSGMYYSQDVGNKRHNQEDALLIMEHPTIPNLRLAVVSDGMGGLNNGEVASHIVVTELKKWFETLNISADKIDTEDFRNKITEKVNEINDLVVQESNGGGATLTGAIIGINDALIMNVGDSRAYKIKNGALEQITEDDSLSHGLFKFYKEQDKSMEEDEMRFFSGNNKICKHIGSEDKNRCTPSFTHLSSRDYDQLILCSDGVCDCLGKKDIVATVNHFDIPSLARALVNGALTHKSIYTKNKDGFVNEIAPGKDNTTAVVVDRKYDEER